MDIYKQKQHKNCILIVDDDRINREILKKIFSSQYCFEEAADGVTGLELIEQKQSELCAIILDVQMPKMTGMEVLRVLNSRGITEKIPVFLITMHDNEKIVREAYTLGVMDFINKPVTPILIQRRAETVIELFRTREELSETVKGQEKKLIENAETIEELHRGTLETLAAAIEFRDVESGQHTSRIYQMTKYILEKTDMGASFIEGEIENVARASIMHDVGKIAISDMILNKPGRLTAEEFEIMKLHTIKGAELLSQISRPHSHPLYRYAADIARHHHERWDGKGYPDGLCGDEISTAAQVVSIVDVYDALVSERVYKKSFDPDTAVKMIKNGECGAFNPILLKCFLQVEPEIRTWYLEGEVEAFMPDDDKSDEVTAIEQAEKAYVTSELSNVMLLITAVKSAFDLIIFVNLSKNTYYTVDCERFLNHTACADGVFDKLIEDGASTIPEPYKSKFLNCFSRKELLKAFHEGKRSVSLEHKQYDDNGGIHWISTSVLFVENSSNGDILEVTLSRCIDDEIDKKEKTKNLLTDALKLAEQANRAKSDFLSRMSHDIRTPINVIMGMTSIISSNIDNRERVVDCLEKIGTSSKFLLGLINDILDFSKIESGKLTLNEAEFDMQASIDDIRHLISFNANQKQQKFTVYITPRVRQRYIGDELRIRRILMNLLENAHKYTQNGGKISLKVEAEKRSDDHDVVTFTIEDNGIGIRQDFLEKLYEPFTQDRGITTGGAGLGLAITQNLVHLMNGNLGVKSEEGIGTCFTVEIPLKISDGKKEINENEKIDLSDISFDGERILLVEDNELNSEIAKTLLEMRNLTVDIVCNGREAVEKFTASESGTYVAVFMDVQMPVMDGYEATKLIRASRHSEAESIPVYAMSASAFYDDVAKAKHSGMNGHISKPVDYDEVVKVLMEILGDKKL